MSLIDTIGFQPELVLFDLDGTLLDTLPDLFDASLSMAISLNIPAPTYAQVERWVGNGAAMLVQRILSNQFVPVSDDSRFDDGLSLYMKAYHQLGNHQSKLYDGVVPMLKIHALQGIKQGVVTNKPSRFTKPLLQQFGILEYFDLVYCGDTFDEKKPHPMPLINAAKALQVKLENCLMVGDSSNDIIAAKACGMPCVGVRGGYNHGRDVSECEPDWVLDCF